MQYRTTQRNKEKISLFGMGCMRLPLTDPSDPTSIDRKEVCRMVDRAIEGGVTYFDTAYPYHGEASEAMVGEALSGGKRQSVNIATKLPVWKVEKAEDMERLLDVQLKRLNTDHIDFYLLHALNKDSWKNVYQLGVTEFLDRMIQKGKIRFPCFSFHDEYEVFTGIVDAYANWEIAQIQLNILDGEYQAGLAGLRYAADRGISLAIMEPLRGGRLANVPPTIQSIWDQGEEGRSAVEMAFRYLYNMPEVSVILSGVSNMAQLEDNIRIFDVAPPNTMTKKELDLVAQVREGYLSRMKVACTGCEYCMPCPAGVNIPGLFSIWNDAAMLDDWQAGKFRYKGQTAKDADASHCVACGACEEACPQHLKVIDLLQQLGDQLG